MNTKSEGPSFDFGLLANVSNVATAAGISLPVALTHDVVEKYLEPPELVFQDSESRLRNLFRCFRMTVEDMGLLKELNDGSLLNPFFFMAVFRMAPRELHEVRLKAVCGVDPFGKSVAVIMLPKEECCES